MILEKLNSIKVTSQLPLNLLLDFNENEYIPLFTINKFSSQNLNLNYKRLSFNIIKVFEKHVSSYNEGNNSPYKQFTIEILTHKLSSGTLTANDVICPKVIFDLFKDYLSTKTIKVSNKGIVTKDSYDNLFNRIKSENYWFLNNIRENQYLCNFGFMALCNANNNYYSLDPIFTFVVKREDLSKLRAAHLLGLPLDTKLVKLWIKKDFLKKSNLEYKYLRIRFIEHFKEYIDNNKIEIIEKENLFSDIFTYLKQIPAKTLKERSEWLTNFANDFIEDEKLKVNLQINGIKLLNE